jgi:hypothetical protein
MTRSVRAGFTGRPIVRAGSRALKNASREPPVFPWTCHPLDRELHVQQQSVKLVESASGDSG